MVSRASKSVSKRCSICGDAVKPAATSDAACGSCGNRLAYSSGEAVRISLAAFPILDQQTMHVFGRVETLLDAFKPKELRLDFRGVQFLSSAGLGKLITLAKNASGLGSRLVLCNLDPRIEEVFEITNIKKMFKFE